MKNFILIAFLILIIGKAANGQYVVTKVLGQVHNAAGVTIRPGSQLKNNERLSWSSMHDKLWVIIIGKGEKIISPSPQAASGNNLFTEILVSSLQLDSRSASLSGRGEFIEKIPDALATNPNSNGKVIIEQENKFLFDPKTFPQTNGSRFFIEVDAPRQAPSIRPLKTDNDTLLISYGDLMTETTGLNIEYKLGYSDKSGGGNSRLVSSFVPYFDLTNDMEGTIANSVMVYTQQNIAKEAVRDSIYQNVYANSGKPNGILFMNLFEQYWASKGVVSYSHQQQSATGLVFDSVEFAKVPVLSPSVGTSRDELPENVSLREFAPPVGSQGLYSSCTAWATSYGARTMSYAIQHGYSKTNNYDEILRNTFAPDFIYNNINKNNDCTHGTVISDALLFMKKTGDIRRVGDFSCGKRYEEDLDRAKTYTIKDYARLNGSSVSKDALVLKMKALLASKHPLPFGMILPEDFEKVDKSGIWYPTQNDRYNASMAKAGRINYLGHAMCVIGYNDAINNGSFEILNSWGSWYGNEGFFWINYDDFYAFLMDIYTINDFDSEAPSPGPTPVVQTTPVVVKPLVPVTNIIPPVKPRLKGNIEFILTKTKEVVPVNKVSIDSRGQMVEADDVPKNAYANYILSQPLYSGDKYRIKFILSQSAYVYIINMGHEATLDELFPLKDNNESALINFNNAILYLPSEKASYKLNTITGKEKMCILVAKSPIDIDALAAKFNNGQQNFYQNIRDLLPDRLLELKSNSYLNDQINFDTPASDKDVLAFFVEINHE